MSNGFCRALTLCAPLVALALTACGVKNLPQAPEGNATQGVVLEPERAGNGVLIGGSAKTVDPTRGPRISSVGSSYDDQVTAAEVSRVPGATRKSFFLDPLLN